MRAPSALTTEQSALWERVRSFSFDDPHAVSKFSERLARENRWSRKFTRRVIEEYRRFAFLSVAAGHPVSPSEWVDQAWHLHLIYTRSYWDEFCGRVLGQPLHHLPSVGGDVEQAKLADWYSRTLASYERLFGEPAPTDIWPTPAERERHRVRMINVDSDQNWIVPKPHLAQQRRSVAMLILLLLIVTIIGCAPIWVPPAIGPLDWRGGAFVMLYAFLLVGATGFGIAWRVWLRGLWQPAQPIPELEPYEVAYLAGAEKRVVNAAVTSLVARNHLQVSGKTLMQAEPMFRECPAIEHSIWDAVGDDGKLDKLHPRVDAKARLVAERLQDEGLVLTSDERWKAQLFPVIPFGLLMLFGIAKLAIGVDRGRPIGFILMLLIVTGLISLLFLFKRPVRTCRGDGHLKLLQERHRDLKSHPEAAVVTSQLEGELEPPANPLRHAALIGCATWPLAFALFGPQSLANGPMDDLHKAFRPKGSTGGDSSGCSTGCSTGSSGCSGGGDSGGGGGCGGGGSGCGGCGGGGD